MRKIIFRKIAGRIIPITISTETKAGRWGGKAVTVRAREGFKRVGEVWGDQWIKRQHRFEVGSHLNPEFRRNGIGSEMYRILAEKIGKLGGKTLHGVTDNIGIIGSVRKKLGKTRGFVRPGDSAMTFVTLLRKRKK